MAHEGYFEQAFVKGPDRIDAGRRAQAAKWDGTKMCFAVLQKLDVENSRLETYTVAFDLLPDMTPPKRSHNRAQ